MNFKIFNNIFKFINFPDDLEKFKIANKGIKKPFPINLEF